MSRISGDVDGSKPIDVPTMMKMLMVVYNNVRDDETMDEVSEAIGDAICMLGDMRAIAQLVMTEGDAEMDFAQLVKPDDPHKIC